MIPIANEIELVQKLVEGNSVQTKVTWEEELGPETLLDASVGFLKHHPAAIDDKRREF